MKVCRLKKTQKFHENQILLEANFWNFDLLKNLGPIGLALLTFMGYKQAERHTSKVFIYIDKFEGKEPTRSFIKRWKESIELCLFRIPNVLCRDLLASTQFQEFYFYILTISAILPFFSGFKEEKKMNEFLK